MVYKEINKAMIKQICKDMKYYDVFKELPTEKVRIDITLSKEAIRKMTGKNRSQYINSLVLASSS